MNRPYLHDERMAFIVGMARSGTTWTFELLRRHPEVQTVNRDDFLFGHDFDETGLFNYLTEMGAAYVLHHLREQYPDKVLLEKTPWHVWHIDKIWKTNDAARIVFLVRNPLLAVESMVRHMDWSRHKAIAFYREGLKKALPHVSDERFLMVRYEDMLAEPEVWLDTICAHIGVEYDPALLEQAPPRPPISRPAHVPIRQYSIQQEMRGLVQFDRAGQYEVIT